MEQEMVALEMKAMVETPVEAKPKATARRYTDIYINGMEIGEANLLSVGKEREWETAHISCQHADGKYYKAEKVMRCKECKKELDFYALRVVSDPADFRNKELNYFTTAKPKPEDTDKDPTAGIVIEGKQEKWDAEKVKEMYWVVPRVHKAKTKKEKSKIDMKNQANVNAIWTLTQSGGLACKYKDRPAVWMGPLLYVLWGDDEMQPAPKYAFPNAVEVDGLKSMVAGMNKNVALILSP